MKKLFCLILFFCIGYLHAQDKSFTEISSFIKNKITCCSVPFTSGAAKVKSITIDSNGDISLFYSDKRPANSFNLFELFKEHEWETGIDTILRGKFIQFSVNENRARLIRFASPLDAKEVYEAFLQLYHLNVPDTNKMIVDMNFYQTVDLINTILNKWEEGGNNYSISGIENGTIIIKGNEKQLFSFNLIELKQPENDIWAGIETVICDARSHAPLSWINFNTPDKTVAFLRLSCNTPQFELQKIYDAFLHLRMLRIKSNISKPN